MKKYTVSLPIINKTVTEKTREKYLREVKRAKADRVFLAISDFGGGDEVIDETVAELQRNVAYFKNEGIDAAVWIGLTLGHGVPLTGADDVELSDDYSPLVNLNGEVIADTHCPLDPKFVKDFSSYIEKIARSGSDLILLDDDFRLSQHGPEFCCACDRHMAKIRDLLGEDISREEFKKLAFSEKSNKYRRAWLDAEGDSMTQLSYAIREAVDKVDTRITVGLCTPHSTWDIDGTDPVETAKILAGDNKPFIRLHSAPYSATISGKPLPHVFELARMFSSFAKDSGSELIAEGDVYPRPRYFVPSSHLEMYDTLIRADGIQDGILKYMIDYVSDPDYETSYVDRHVHLYDLECRIGEMFSRKSPVGVDVSVRPGLVRDADLSIGLPSYLYPYPWAGIFLSLASIPTVYSSGGIATAIFGEEARHVNESKPSKGAVLDAISAQILTERGIDVGLDGIRAFTKGSISEIKETKDMLRAAIWHGDVRIAEASVKDGAKTVALAKVDRREMPFAYSYENGDGQRFLVYLFDSMGFPMNSNALRGYLNQKILVDHIEWISGKKLPARCDKNPDLYIKCSKDNDGKMAVALFNCYPDSILEPKIKLDAEYKRIKFAGCSGNLSGDTVTLDRPIGAYEFCAFEVEM